MCWCIWIILWNVSKFNYLLEEFESPYICLWHKQCLSDKRSLVISVEQVTVFQTYLVTVTEGGNLMIHIAAVMMGDFFLLVQKSLHLYLSTSSYENCFCEFRFLMNHIHDELTHWGSNLAPTKLTWKWSSSSSSSYD